jgi:hypothetical protein
MELDRLKIEIDTQTERLNTKYMQEINFEKEKSLQNHYSTQQKYEKERKDLETNFNKLQKQLEQRLSELEATNKVNFKKKKKKKFKKFFFLVWGTPLKKKCYLFFFLKFLILRTWLIRNIRMKYNYRNYDQNIQQYKKNITF